MGPSNPGSGLVDALNFGIASARARLIARMDGDDIALPERFQRQYDFLEAHPEIDVVGTQVTSSTRTARDRQEDGPAGKPRRSGQDPAEILLSPPSYGTDATNAVESVGGYRSQLIAAEDLDLWLRLAERGKLANLPEALLFYRLHRGR